MSKKRSHLISDKRRVKGVHPSKKSSPLRNAPGAPDYPNFINQGGPVINTPQVYILFVGDWSSPDNQNRALRLQQFVNDFLNSSYMNILTQYGCGNSGTVGGSVFVAAPNQNLGASDFNNILQTAIGNNQIPEPTGSFAYLLYLDDSIAVNDGNIVMCEPTSDTAFGFHDSFTTTANNVCSYAVVPGLTDSCLSETCSNDGQCSLHLAQTQEQRQTQVTSHELSEMFSDPQPQTDAAWTDLSDPNPQHPIGENGDICNGQSATITVGPNTWTVQRMYSHTDDQNGNPYCIVTL